MPNSGAGEGIIAGLISLCLFAALFGLFSLPNSTFEIDEEGSTAGLVDGSQEDTPASGEFSFDLESTPDERAILLVTSTQPIDRVNFNQSQLSHASETQTATLLPGGTLHVASFTIPRNFLFPGLNRISIFPSDGAEQPASQSIRILSADKAGAAVERIAMWNWLLPTLALAVGVLGLLLCVGGLLLGQRMAAYLPIVVMAGSFCLLGALSFYPQALAWAANSVLLKSSFVLGLGVALCAVIIGAAQRKERLVPAELGTAALLLFALVLIAIALGSGIYLLPILFTFCIVAISAIAFMGYRSARLFWVDLNAFRTKLITLQNTIEEQADELDAKSRLIADEMQRSAVLKERQRMMRDIHDGIGGQLLSLMLRVKSGSLNQVETASGIKQSLTDLRLVVDSADHLGGDLMSALATFRSRAQQQLGAAGIKLDWHFKSDMAEQLRSTSKTLDIYRFMQEAVTNIVRHSGAKVAQVKIAYQSSQDRLVIEILDDGCGLPDESELRAGKGLTNLGERASQLNGQHSLEHGPQGTGTLVRLSLDPS